ncbi:MAG: IS66 family transposase [Alphaproteobacteria bacterium]
MTRPPPLPDLSRLSHAEKDALIVALWSHLNEAAAQIEALTTRLAALEAKLGEPPKTPDNSSTPPARGHKPNKPPGRKGRRKRPGTARQLHPDPDRIVEARAETCPHCAAALTDTDQTMQAVYDRVELPPIKALVTRVRLHGGTCRRCGRTFTAPTPVGLEPGSPFGPSIEALAVYLRFCHAIGFERLSALFAEVFGVSVSEGALANLFKRVKPRFDDQAEAIARRVTDSAIVCSDETSARVAGRNWWEWVFLGTEAALHVIEPSRGKTVPEAIFRDRRPAVWVSDLLGAQQGHAEDWQVCLAHQLRDLQYAIDAGDDVFAPTMRRIVLRAIAIGKRRDRLRDSTLRSYRAELDRRVDAVMMLRPTNRHGIRLRKRFAKVRDNLFVFVTERDVPYTNNASERALRPSVVFRKVTNGFRSAWGAGLFAGVRSAIDTGRCHGLTPYQAIRNTLERRPVLIAA